MFDKMGKIKWIKNKSFFKVISQLQSTKPSNAMKHYIPLTKKLDFCQIYNANSNHVSILNVLVEVVLTNWFVAYH